MIRFVLLAAAIVAAGDPSFGRLALPARDRVAAFKAAGFKRVGGQWRKCDHIGPDTYSPGRIATVRDLNKDGRPEAIITEGGTYCFGNTATGFHLVSKQADGRWRLMLESHGIPNVLRATGDGGWPDIEVGGPGFCHPTRRWDGRSYKIALFRDERVRSCRR